METMTIISAVIAVVGIVMLTAVYKKAFKSAGALRNIFMLVGIFAVIYGVVGFGADMTWWNLGAGDKFFLTTALPGTTIVSPETGASCPTGQTLVNGKCQLSFTGQSTATYTATDKYSSTKAIIGTSYYKVGSNRATSTAYSNVNEGDSITYWISNDTYFTEPVTKTAQKGVTQFEAKGYLNSTATVSLYDLVGRQTIDKGVANVSLGANANANIEITYQGTSEGSSGPFGGVMILEYNSTMGSVSCVGDGLMATNPFHVTYTTRATPLTYKVLAYDGTIDDGTASVKRITCQFKNGATAGTGETWYVTFLPANYYVTKSGDIVLDVEKYADGDTTRTAPTFGQPWEQASWS